MRFAAEDDRGERGRWRREKMLGFWEKRKREGEGGDGRRWRRRRAARAARCRWWSAAPVVVLGGCGDLVGGVANGFREEENGGRLRRRRWSGEAEEAGDGRGWFAGDRRSRWWRWLRARGRTQRREKERRGAARTEERETSDPGASGHPFFRSAKYEVQITEYLLSRSDVELSAVNENGFTALDLVENSPTRDFETLKLLNILLESGARTAKDLNLPLKTSLSGTNSTLENSRPAKSAADDDGNGLEQMRGALILTASIIAAATFITPENWDETNFFSTNAISLVLSLSIVLLLFSGCPLDNEFCAWILMALMYTTLYSMAWNFTSTIGEFEDRGSFLVPLLLVLFVFFPLLGLVALARTIKLIKQAPRKLREFVNGRSRPTTRSLAAA